MKNNLFLTVDDFLSVNADQFETLGQKSETARQIIALSKGTAKNDENLVVLLGWRMHEKALAAGLSIPSFLICPSIVKWPKVGDISLRYIETAERCYIITPKTFARFSDYGDPDGILSLARLPMRKPDELMLEDDSVVFVMDGLTKPGNVGVILRSCDGAGVSAVMTCNLRTRLTHPNAVKASMGAVFSMPIAGFDNARSCREWLMGNGFTIYIADPNSENRYDRLCYPGKIAVVLGNEHIGASRVWYDGSAHPFSIPMCGACDSLNVSVAAAILAYEIRSRKAGVNPSENPTP